MKRYLLFTFPIHDNPWNHGWEHFKNDFESVEDALLYLINHEKVMDGAQIVDTMTMKILHKHLRNHKTNNWMMPIIPVTHEPYCYKVVLTRKQREAIKRKYDVSKDKSSNYLEFRRRVYPEFGCIRLPWCGMVLGIEPDGYTGS